MEPIDLASLPIIQVLTMAEWAAVVSLRYEVLRKDWAQPFSSATDVYDEADGVITLALLHPQSGEALATARVQPYSKDKYAQVRYVAVHKAYQSSGLGTKIMLAIHEEAKKLGYENIYLEARETALPLYDKLGYYNLGFHDLRLGLIPHYSCEIAL